MFGSFLKFANFDDFFSSLQNDSSDDNNNNDNDNDNDNRHNDDGDVYLLSGCELPEQDLLEDTDFDLR